MTRKILIHSVIVLAFLLQFPRATAGEPTDTDAPPLELWNDATFRKEFLGSYGTNSELEPRVAAADYAQLEKVLPLLASDLEAAAEMLTPMLGPDANAIFDFTLGNVRFQQERLEDAANLYLSALDKFPAYLRAHKNLGLVRVRQGKFAEATPHLSRVIQLGAADGMTYGLLGYGYSSSGQFVGAESAYRGALLLQPEMQDWKMGLAHSLLRQGKYAEGVALCEELIQRSPEKAELWLMQANAYIGMAQPMEAAANYEIVERMGRATVRSALTLGDIYVNEKLWDLATRSYLVALDLEPEKNASQLLRRAEALAQRDALSQANLLLERIASNSPEGALDETERKTLLKLQARIAVAEDPAGRGGAAAAEILEEIVAMDPLDGEALILLGEHYASNGDAERGIFYYERAASIPDFEAQAKVRLGQLLVGQVRYDEALPLLRRAQELEPRDDVARYVEQVERAARNSR